MLYTLRRCRCLREPSLSRKAHPPSRLVALKHLLAADPRAGRAFTATIVAVTA